VVLALSLSAGAAHASPAPLTLQDAVEQSLAKNERARIADLDVTVARAAVQKAHARFLPALSLGAGDTFRPEQLGASAGAPPNAASATLSVNQPLLDAAAFPLLDQARDALLANQDQAGNDKRTLAFDAARAFFLLLDAQAVRSAAQRRLASAQAALSDAQARVNAQLASSNDATRAQVDLASAAREVTTDTGSVRTAALQLGLLMSAPAPETLVPPDAVLQASAKPLTALEPLVKAALSRRLDLTAQQHAAQAARDAAREPMLRAVPTLGVSAQAQATTNDAATGRWHDESLSLTLSWALYDQGQRYADARARSAQAEIADLQALALARTVASQVWSAAASLQAAQGAYAVADAAVAVARKNADETAALYKQGLAKAIELIDANDQLFLAEVSDAEARYAMALAYLDLRSSLGLDPLGLEL